MLVRFNTEIASPRPPLRWTLVILAYLGLEWVYNQHLLVLMTFDTITLSQLEWTEAFGKGIASIGLSLVFIKFVRRPHPAVFIFSCVVVYAVLTLLFSSVLRLVPDTFRHASFYTALQRNRIVIGDDPRSRLESNPQEAWYVAPLLLSQLHVTLSDPQWSSWEKTFRTPIEDKAVALKKNKAAYWGQYLYMQNLQYKLNHGWKTYLAGMKQVNRYRGTSWEKRARERFMEKSKGLPPDLSRTEFNEAIAPGFQNAMTSTLIPGHSALGLTPLRFQDIPEHLGETDFYAYLEHTATTMRSTLAPTLETIRTNTTADNAVTLLLIPPVSIALSLFSIGLNAMALGATWAVWVSRRRWVGYGFSLVFIALIALGIANSISVAVSHRYWQEQHAAFGQSHPILGFVSSIPMRVQPWLCGANEPTWIRTGMLWVYTKSKTTPS
jgi:hypothetical protein